MSVLCGKPVKLPQVQYLGMVVLELVPVSCNDKFLQSLEQWKVPQLQFIAQNGGNSSAQQRQVRTVQTVHRSGVRSSPAMRGFMPHF